MRSRIEYAVNHHFVPSNPPIYVDFRFQMLDWLENPHIQNPNLPFSARDLEIKLHFHVPGLPKISHRDRRRNEKA